MLFPTFPFFVLWIATFAVYWLGPRDQRFRLPWLLFASCVFYAHWSPWYLGLIALSTSVDFVVGRRLPGASSQGRRRMLLACSLGVNLALLAAFKYGQFLVDALRSLGLPLPAVAAPPLPLGISFYTFEAVSYVVDVYRGRIPPETSLLRYAAYIMFFPHLVAGPIVRPHELLPQLRAAKHRNWWRLEAGLRLFLLGLFKKAVVADHLAVIVDPVFAAPGQWGTGALWLATLAYSVQIYCDFSGYSDMAVGVAQTFGLHLPDNFDRPYLAGDIAEFWRRWHVTLSRWLRDYLYIPLGGSRGGELLTMRNLLVTMLLGGLWHGPAWHFVAWGGYHGLLLATHRWWRRADVATLPRPLGTALTFLAVTLGWVLFRASSLPAAGAILRRMVGGAPGLSLGGPEQVLLAVVFVTVIAAHALSRLDATALARRLPPPVWGLAMATGWVLAQFLLPATGAPFIYFQF